MAHNGTIVGSPTFAAGQFNDAVSGDGSNYITLPGTVFDAFMQAGMSWTIGVWLKASTVPASSKVAFSVGNTCPWIGVINGGNLAVTIYGTGGFGVTIDSGVGISDASWHYIEVGMQGGTDVYIFVDGVLALHVTGVMTGVAGSAPRVLDYYAGSFPFVGTTATGYAVDELSIWNSCLHTSGFTPPAAQLAGTEAGLLGLYHFNDNADDSAAVITAATPVLGEVGGTTIAMSWQSATGGTSPYTYQPQYNENGAGWTDQGSPITSLSYTFTGLTAATPYAVRYMVTDSALSTSLSDSISTTTLSAGLNYNVFTGNSPNFGQACIILVPNADATIPYDPGVPTPLVILFHPSGIDETFATEDSNFQILAPGLMDAGYLVVCSNAGGENWGNQAGVDDYTDSWRFAIANYNVSVKVGISASMGGLCGLTSLSQWQIPGIVCWLGIYPVCNLQSMYAGFGAQINSAYGIGGAHTYTDTTAGYDPVLRSGISFRGDPLMCIASPDDVTVNWNTNSKALQTLTSGSCNFTLVQASGVHGSTDHWDKAVTYGLPFIAAAITSPPPTSGRIGGGGGGGMAGAYTLVINRIPS